MSDPEVSQQAAQIEEALKQNTVDSDHDHAVDEGKPVSPISRHSETSQDGTVATEAKENPLARKSTDFEDTDDDDPFGVFPALSITMSSTRAPYSRRSTVTTLGRRLTRQETTQTLKSVRSRFTEVRSEFDENVYSWSRKRVC